MSGIAQRIGSTLTLRRVVVAVLAGALAVQAGRLVWLFVEPAPESPTTVASGDLSVLGRFDAFFRTGERSALAETTASGSQQMRLFGVRAGGPGEGAAILGLADGRQLAVAVGEEIEPGLVLQSVEADHVVLARGGALSRLEFGEAPMGAASPPPPPTEAQVVTPEGLAPPSAQAPALDAASLTAAGAVRPRMRGLAVTGFVLGEPAASGPLAAVGLRPGDVITAIDDIELTSPGRLAEARTRLTRNQSATLRFERDGATQTITVRTGR